MSFNQLESALQDAFENYADKCRECSEANKLLTSAFSAMRQKIHDVLENPTSPEYQEALAIAKRYPLLASKKGVAPDKALYTECHGDYEQSGVLPCESR